MRLFLTLGVPDDAGLAGPLLVRARRALHRLVDRIVLVVGGDLLVVSIWVRPVLASVFFSFSKTMKFRMRSRRVAG